MSGALVRTLIVSGYAVEDVLRRIEHNDVTQFINKPYKRSNFLEMVSKTLPAEVTEVPK